MFNLTKSRKGCAGMAAALLFATAGTAAQAAQFYAYVPNLGSNSVSVINTTTRAVVTTLTGFTTPSLTVSNLDGSIMYVLSYQDKSILKITTATGAVTPLVASGGLTSGSASAQSHTNPSSLTPMN